MSSSTTLNARRSLLPFLLAGAVLGIGVVVSALVAWHFHGLVVAEAEARFARLQENLRQDVSRRFTTPHYGLGGARGVFAASVSVERKEFKAYVDSRNLPVEFPGILGFGMIKPVARTDLATFTAAEAADGDPGFAVQTTGDDPQCYVITGIFPRATNERAWGLDVGAEPVRRQAIEQAIDSGRVTLTRCITLVQDGQRTPGFLMLMPVFRNGTAPVTPGERRAALHAFVYAPIRAVDLLAGLDEEGDGQALAEVWEGSPTRDGTRLHPLTGSLPESARFQHDQVLNLYGIDLHLRIRSTPALDGTVGMQSPLLVLLGGTIIALLAATTMLLLGRSRARVLAAAHAMTRDLREAKAEAEIALRDAEVYRSTLDQYAIVSMTDARGRIIHVNSAFCTISGYTRDELLGKDHRLINSGTHDATFWRTMWSSVLAGKPWRGVVCNRAKDGSLYWVDSLITGFMGADGTLDRIVSIRFDITAQKRLELDLQRVRDRLSIALDAGDVGIWEWNIVTNALVWDERMHRLYGTSPERFPGAYEAWESAVHPEDKARATEELNAAVRGERPFDTQFRVVWPDGSIHHIRARAEAEHDLAGKTVRLIGTNWDITVEKENEARRQVLTTIVEQAPDFIATKHLDGRLQWCNREGLRLIGQEIQADPQCIPLDELHPPWAVQQLQSVAMPHAIANDVWSGESALVHRDGTEIPVAQVLMVHRDEHGFPQRFSTIMRDLRQQKAGEERLRTLMAFQRGVLDGADVSIIATDTLGIVTLWNAAATRMLQWTPEEMVGKQTPAVIHDLDEVVARAQVLTQELGVPIEPGFDTFVAKTRIKHIADEQEWTYVRKDGSRFPVLLSVTALRDADDTIVGYLGIAADITERSRQRHELEQAMEAAKAGAQAKADFLAVMSHEIRTPMNGVIGMTNLLVKTTLDPQQREYVETVRTCGESLLTLINDILDFSKLEAGRVVLETIPFSPTRVIEDVVLLFNGQAEQKGLALSYQLPANLPPVVMGDPTRLRQVLLNLVSNAMKFTLRGSVTVSATASTCDGQAALTITVKDTGVGMTPEQVARLGEAFMQADSSTTRRFGGSGLGMTISKALIGLMQGDFQVESIPDQGSTFRIVLRLPLGSADLHHDERVSLRGRRVLCVDDDPTSLRQMQDLCHGWSMQVEAFATAQELMVRLRRHDSPPDLLLTDHEMPGIDGVMLTRLVHADDRYATLPVVIASSDPDRARFELRTLGTGLVVDKPLQATSLHTTLHAALRPARSPGAMAEDAPPIRLGRVLVADDNRINQRVIVSMLKGYAGTVDTVDDGAKALAAVQAQTYDLVLMDCQMPEMDGYQATQAIRAHEQQRGLPRLPIIALTAHAMQGARDECLAAGMDDYLSKPVRESDLSGVLQRTFANARPSTSAANTPTTTTGPDPLVALRAVMDEEDIRSIAEAVVAEYPRMIDAVDNATEVGDRSGVARIAHNFKGSGASLELRELQQLGRELEQQARTAAPESLTSLIGRLKQEARRAVRVFQDFLGRPKG